MGKKTWIMTVGGVVLATNLVETSGSESKTREILKVEFSEPRKEANLQVKATT